MNILFNFSTGDAHIISFFMFNKINFCCISSKMYSFWFHKRSWIICQIFYISTNFTSHMSVKPKFFFLKTSLTFIRWNSIPLNTCHNHFICINIFGNRIHRTIFPMNCKILLSDIKRSVHCRISCCKTIHKSSSIHFIVIVINCIIIICRHSSWF